MLTERGSSLLLVAIAGLVAVFSLLVLAWTTVNPVIEDLSRTEGNRLPKLELMQQLKHADLEASIALRNASLLTNPELSQQEMQRYERLRQAAAAALQSLKGMPSSGEGARLLNNLLAGRQTLEATRAQAVAQMRIGYSDESVSAMTLNLQSALDAYLVQVDKLYQFKGARTNSSVTAARVAATRTRWLLILSGVTAA